MGEIKSTLDLVMERTRHLSLSAEEKASQQRADFEKRLQGLLQQYADDALSAAGLKEKVADLQTRTQMREKPPLIRAVVGRIDPDRDNGRWLDLLADMAPGVCKPLEAALSSYHRQRDELIHAGRTRLREHLARELGIQGTAVVPNAAKDTATREGLSSLQQRIRDRIGVIAGQTD